MPQPLDPAVQALIDSAPRAPFVLPDPPPSAAEMALAIRARDRPASPAPVDEFHGTITERTVPVRWGSVPGRVYRPHSAEARLPAVAFFHGGGFIGGDLDSHDRLCRELATASHALVLSVAYRLAPEAPFPAGLEDAYDATIWLADAADDLRIDPQRIAVAGDSAGGNLATAAALMAKRKGTPKIAFQLLLYPKLDFVNEYPSYVENGADGIPRALSQIFDDCYLPDMSQRSDPLASPVLATDLAGMPPGLILTADADTLRDEAEAYGQALRRAGVEIATLRAIGQAHGFATMIESVPSARLITQAAANLLGYALRSSR
jgi:acetyl esterase